MRCKLLTNFRRRLLTSSFNIVRTNLWRCLGLQSRLLRNLSSVVEVARGIPDVSSVNNMIFIKCIVIFSFVLKPNLAVNQWRIAVARLTHIGVMSSSVWDKISPIYSVIAAWGEPVHQLNTSSHTSNEVTTPNVVFSISSETPFWTRNNDALINFDAKPTTWNWRKLTAKSPVWMWLLSQGEPCPTFHYR